jgi:hypothetical protein
VLTAFIVIALVEAAKVKKKKKNYPCTPCRRQGEEI